MQSQEIRGLASSLRVLTGAAGTEAGFYQCVDPSGTPLMRRAIRVMNEDEASVDWDNTLVFNLARDIHFRYNRGFKTWDINNPLWDQPLAAGEHTFTFFQQLLTFDRPVVDINATSFGSGGVKQSNFRAHQWETSYLPTTPFGSAVIGSDELIVATQVVANNAQDRAQKMTYSSWNPSNGSPLPVTIMGMTASTHEFMIPARTSWSFELDPGESGIQGAWGSIKAEYHLDVATNFITFQVPSFSPAGSAVTGTVDAQAGIAASHLDVTHVLSVEKGAGGFDTALAVLNPTAATANIDINLIGDDTVGQAAQAGPAGEPFASAELVLQPGTQVSRFFSELLDIEVEEFIGTITLDSDTQIAVTTLRTIDGKQASSLPGGTPLAR